MALLYAEAKSKLDEVAKDLRDLKTRLQEVQTRANQANSLATALPSKYASLSTEINDLAAAAPSDEVLQHLKAEKDKLAGEFTQLSTLAGQMKTATDSVNVG